MRNFKIILFLSVIILTSCQKELPEPEPQPQYDPRNISRTYSTQSYGPWITIGPDGTVYVVWMDGGGTEHDPSRFTSGIRCRARIGVTSRYCRIACTMMDPAWFPDSRTLVFSALNPDRTKFVLWKINIDGTGLEQITF